VREEEQRRMQKEYEKDIRFKIKARDKVKKKQINNEWKRIKEIKIVEEQE